MCCKVIVAHNDPELMDRLMELGDFHYKGYDWRRQVPHEHTEIMAKLDNSGLTVQLLPQVNNWKAHKDRRDSAGIMFEIATRYAQAAGTNRVEQAAITVHECKEEREEDGSPRPVTRRIWNQAEDRIDWDRVCPGWREVFLNTDELEEA